MPVFPLEIFSDIAEHLAQGGTFESLRAFSATSFSLLHLSRPYLFSTIVINEGAALSQSGPKNTSITASQFAYGIKKSPHIIRYIRYLDIGLLSEDVTVPNFPVALKALDKVRSLDIGHHLEHPVELQTAVNWATCPIRPAILHILSLPDFRELNLGKLYVFPMADIFEGANIKSLSMCCDVVASEGFIPTSKAMNLTKFSVVCGLSKVAQTLLGARRVDGTPAFNLSNLQELTAVHIDRDVQEETDLFHYLSTCSHKLKILSLTCLSPAEGLHGKIIPPHLMHNLSNLRLDFVYIPLPSDAAEADPQTQDPYLGFCAELKKMVGKNMLEEITISARISLESALVYLEQRPNTMWSAIDDLLSQEGWPKLAKVSVCVSVNVFETNEFAAQSVRERFARVRQQTEVLMQITKDRMAKMLFPKLCASNAITFDLTVGSLLTKPYKLVLPWDFA